MTDLRGFAKRMHVVADGVPERADKLVRTIALSVQSLVAYATPVDTGQARRNWQTGLDEPPTGTLPALATPAESLADSIATAQRVVATYKGGRDGAAIHITNNLPYIVRLDNGWSKQAPVGYVERAAQTAVDAVNNSKLVKE